MKRTLLSALAMAFAFAAHAQLSGVAVSPAGATADDIITITVWPDQTCPTPATDPAKTLEGASTIRLHSGVTIAGADWQNVVDAGAGADNSIVGFVPAGNGTWTKTFRPRDYYGVAAGTAIDQICMVLNGGPDGTNWDREGKRDDAGACTDFFVPFPVAAPFVSLKKKMDNGVFTVRQNQPNPVSGSTTIRFFLNRAENVTVRVTNILGETVKTLHSGKMLAGDQSVTWNANGSTAGIYFYTIEAGNAVESRKMVVR